MINNVAGLISNSSVSNFSKCRNSKVNLTTDVPVGVLASNSKGVYAAFINNGQTDIALVLDDKSNAVVEVKGIIRKSGALNNTELITVLPVGYRPNQTIRIVTWGGAGTSQLQIVANGNLTLLSANNALCWS